MMIRKKAAFFSCLLFALAGTVLFLGCSEHTDVWESVEGEGTHVLVSFPPLYCFAKNVAGEHAKVISLTTTIGPHDFHPSAHDAHKALKADLFLVNGLGLDDWIVKVKNSSNNMKLKVVEVAKEALPKEKRIETKDDGHDHSGHGHAHSHGPHDPHAWLGIEEAILMVEKIRDVLSDHDKNHKEEFHKNAAAYIKELRKLHADGKKKFEKKKNKRIMPTHDSLRYFARSFGIEVVDSIQPQPGQEASSVKLQELIKIATKKDAPVRIITVEPQYSKATAQTLINQIKPTIKDVQMVEFDTLETAPTRSEVTKDFYLKAMRENINRLAKAFE